MIEGALAAAASAIRARDGLTALEHLLDAFAATRSHALCKPIDACARRASRWQRPWIADGTESSIWEMQAVGCDAADLTFVLESVPERNGELLEKIATQRTRPDPRLGHALLEIASGKRKAYLRSSDWAGLFRGIARHGDDVTLAEIARLAPSFEGDVATGFARAKLPAPASALDAADRAAIASVLQAIAETAPDPALEAVARADARVAPRLRALAIGSASERDTAFASFAHDEIGLAARPLERLLRVAEYPDRVRVLRLLASPFAYRDFFEKFPDLHGALAKTIDDGWGTYVALMSDADPAVQAAAMHLCAHLFIPVRDVDLRTLYRQCAEAATDPLVRAAFLVAQGRQDRDHSDRPTEWPLGDPHPVVAFAAAVAEALGRGSWITREALALLEAPPPSVDERLFPWFRGDLGAMARATIAHCQLEPIATTLADLEQRVRDGTSRHDDTSGEWRARNLVPRVFGRTIDHVAPRSRGPGLTGAHPLQPTPGTASLVDRAALTAEQRRLVALLAFYRSKALAPLRIEAPTAGETRRALGLEGQPLRIPPSIAYADWTPALERRFEIAYEVTEIPAIRYASDGRGRTVGLAISDDISTCAGALEHSGVVALRGGAPLASWIASGHRLDTLRVLYLDALPPALVDELATAPTIRQIRRLRICTEDDATKFLASPQLAELEALEWWRHGDVRVLARLPKLRELKLRGQNAQGLDVLAEAFAAMRAPLERLVLIGDVPLDAIGGNDAFAIRELVIEQCTLRGGELLGALRELRELRAARSTFDDVAAAALASCAALEVADLSGTKLGDAGARALAAGPLPSLAKLDLRETAVRDLDVIERLAALPGMRELQLSMRPRIELWLANRAPPHVVLPPLEERHLWRPFPVEESWHAPGDLAAIHAAAVARDAWPAPPVGFGRLFVVERDIECSDCRGTGYTPEGHCPNHYPLEQVRHAGPLPLDAHHALLFSRAHRAVAEAEASAAEVANLLADRGLARPRTIMWRFDRDEYDAIALAPGPLDELATRGRLGKTLLWPIDRLHEAPGDPLYRAMVAILDAGFSIQLIGETEFHLGYHIRKR